MTRRLTVSKRTWPLKEPFAISRGVETECDAIVVGLADGDVEGLGEAIGVSYHDETVASMTRQIEDVRAAIEAGATREQLLDLLPAGGARNAVDGALWDLEAKASGVRAWERAGVGKGGSIVTAVTIGIRSLDAYAASARALADHPWIKIKVGSEDPIAAIETVRRAAPRSKLVVDPNQAWSVAELAELAPRLVELGVDLLEQPVDAAADDDLAGYKSPIPLCADEALQTEADLPHVMARYDFVNIKLDKTGGLTAALALAHAARKADLRLMVGCMMGGSIAMAPGMVLGQLCEVCDLDGPLLQAEDWPGGIECRQGVMSPPWPKLWG